MNKTTEILENLIDNINADKNDLNDLYALYSKREVKAALHQALSELYKSLSDSDLISD